MTTTAQCTDRLPARSAAAATGDAARPAEGGEVVQIETLRGPVQLGDPVPPDPEIEETLLQSGERPIVRLLIVEDDDEDYDVMEEMLARAPETRFEIIWATSIEAGLRRVASESFDACLVDDGLAGRSGLEFAEIALRRGFEQPIIVVAATASFELEQAAMELGIADFLEKEEIDTGRLDRCIRFAISRSRTTVRRDPPAMPDRLTGVANRTLFLERMRHALATARRQRRSAAVVAVDIDGFRAVNQRLGHDAGDRLLGIMAERLGHRLRDNDTVARLEADSFAVVIDNLQRPDDAARFAQKLAEVIEAPTALAGEVLRPTASLGIALYPIDASAPDELLGLAEAAMHRAKLAGGRACRFHDFSIAPSNAGHIIPVVSDRLAEPAPRGSLETAFQEGRFELYFQPQITLRSPVVSLSLQPRLRDPERGLLRADRFLSAFVEQDLIGRLTDWMVETAAASMVAAHAAGCRVDHFAVPVPRPFVPVWPDMAERAIATLQRHGLKAENLELEFDEAAVFEDLAGQSGIIQGLRARGLRVALRGYGDAMLSLTLLRDQNVETLKLAQSLLEDVPGDKHRTLFADAVIQLARHLQVRLVAESVTGNGQLQMLKRAGCDAAECAMSDPAMPAEDLIAWLQRQRRRHDGLV